jgi:hypothetical protein
VTAESSSTGTVEETDRQLRHPPIGSPDEAMPGETVGKKNRQFMIQKSGRRPSYANPSDRPQLRNPIREGFLGIDDGKPDRDSWPFDTHVLEWQGGKLHFTLIHYKFRPIREI